MAQPTSVYVEAKVNYLVRFGEMVVEWNKVEGRLRELLGVLVGTETALIVTAELGGRGLADALNSFGNDVISGKAGAAITHYVKYAEAIRGHRNYYVHGVLFVMRDGENRPYGAIQTYSAKGKVVAHSDTATMDDLAFVINHCGILIHQVDQLVAHFRTLDPGPPIQPPLLRPVPKVLEKRRHYLRQLWKPQPEQLGS